MRRKTKRIAVIAAAIAVFVLSATTVLAVNLGLHERFIEFFGIGDGQSSLLDGAFGEPVASATDNGATVEVLQTIADNTSLYVLYDVTLPDGVEFPDESELGEVYYFQPLYFKEFELSVGGVSVYPLISWDVLAKESNKVTAMALFQIDASGTALPTGKISFSLKDINYTYFEELTSSKPSSAANPYGPIIIPLVEGKWNLEWDFDFQNTARVIEPNKTIYSDGQSTVTKISVSPISIAVYVDYSRSPALNGFTYSAFDVGSITVNLKDGSALDSGGFRFMSVNGIDKSIKESDGEIVRGLNYCVFDSVIDPENVASVTIGDTTIVFD